MLNSILNNMGADNSAPMEVHTVNQEEILQFKCNPLAVVILHTELQSTLDEVIGDEAYDVGHLFDYGQPNGDAGCIGCVCQSSKKGKGFSSHPFRDVFGGEYRNDYFDLDYAGHDKQYHHQIAALPT